MSPIEAAARENRTDQHQDRRGRDLFEAIGEPVIVHDLDGHILDVNPAACRHLGYTREELLRRTTQDIEAPEFAGEFAERLEKQRAAGRLVCQGWHLTRDGRTVPVEVNSSVFSFDGRPAILALVRDVSQRLFGERRQETHHLVTAVLAESDTIAEAAPRILRAVCEGLGWDTGTLWSVDRQADPLRCVDVQHLPGLDLADFTARTREMTFARGVDLPGRVWACDEPLWCGELLAEHDFPRVALAARQGFRGAFAVPVHNGAVTTGVLEFFSRTLDRPDDALRAMLGALGSQVGQFLERKRVEEALRESEGFYHSLVESLPQHIIRKDCEGRFTFVNQRVCKILKRPLEEIVGKTDFDLFPPELAAKYRRDDRLVFATGENLETIEEHQTAEGTTLYVQIVKTPIYDRHGALIGTQVIFWDVTERKRWEEALTESERRYRQLTEASQDAIVVADQEGRITLFNPAAERIFQYTAREAISQPLELLIPAEFQERHRQGIQRYIATRQPHLIGHPAEMRGRRKDGTEFPLDLSISAIDLGGELQFLGAIRDCTERNRMRTALVQTEKLASIGLLSAGVAHEINNPLAYVANNLVVLERDCKGLMALLDVYEAAGERLARADPDTAARARKLAEEVDLPYVRDNLGRLLTRTRAGVERVTRIIHSLRGLARTDSPQMEEVSLPDLVDMSLEMIRGQLQRQGIAIELHYGPTRLRCVPSQISQILLNLLVNAHHAVESRPQPGPGKIQVCTRQEGTDFVIEVADNGCGIDPRHLPRLFDPFFTTKPVGEGTGLGLSITHGIVTGHGGQIEVDSKLNEGSRFRIILPQPAPEGLPNQDREAALAGG